MIVTLTSGSNGMNIKHGGLKLPGTPQNHQFLKSQNAETLTNISARAKRNRKGGENLNGNCIMHYFLSARFQLLFIRCSKTFSLCDRVRV